MLVLYCQAECFSGQFFILTVAFTGCYQLAHSAFLFVFCYTLLFSLSYSSPLDPSVLLKSHRYDLIIISSSTGQPPVALPLNPLHHHEQNPKTGKLIHLGQRLIHNGDQVRHLFPPVNHSLRGSHAFLPVYAGQSTTNTGAGSQQKQHHHLQ